MKKEGDSKKQKKKPDGEVEYLIVERIDTKLTEVGMSRSELASRIKEVRGTIARNTLTNWAARKTIPPADIALAIADALQCSVRWLITGIDDIEEEYSVEEKMLLTKFRAMDEQGKNYVKALLNANSAADEAPEPKVLIAVEKKAAAS
jgi:transcriptional regulator with XRE-family HTH domain